MHEHKILDNLIAKLDQMATEVAPAQLTSMHVILGVFSHFTPEHFREHFEHAAREKSYKNLNIVIDLDESIESQYAHEVVLESVSFSDE